MPLEDKNALRWAQSGIARSPVDIDVQRLLQMVRQSEAVHHDAEFLAVARAIEARNGLQRRGLADGPIQVLIP